MMFIRSIVLTLLVLTLNSPAYAQSGDTPAEPTTAQPGTDERRAEAQRDKQDPDRQDKNKGDIFKPSEEISEDFAVSFPVDI